METCVPTCPRVQPTTSDFVFIVAIFQTNLYLSLHFGYASVSGNCHGFKEVASAHLDQTTVYYTSVHVCHQNTPVYPQDFTSETFANVSLSYQYHIQYPAFHGMIVFKVLTLSVTVFVCYSGLYIYVFKLSQEDLSPACVIIC